MFTHETPPSKRKSQFIDNFTCDFFINNDYILPGGENFYSEFNKENAGELGTKLHQLNHPSSQGKKPSKLIGIDSVLSSSVDRLNSDLLGMSGHGDAYGLGSDDHFLKF